MAERKKVSVVLNPKAEQSIVDISIYIADKGHPETALEFKDSLYEFADSLSLFPLKYPICKHPALAKRNFHCAVFHKNYIFVYKLVKKQIHIYNILHTLTSPAFYNA
jgi:plasmid stabilization system protein ParE